MNLDTRNYDENGNENATFGKPMVQIMDLNNETVGKN